MNQQFETNQTTNSNSTNTSNAYGIASFITGLLSIFMLSILLVPCAILLAIIGLIHRQFVWSILGLVFAILGFITSPIFLALVGISGLVSLGALGALLVAL